MRLRLIPVLIVFASLGLVIKTGEIWHGVGTLARIQSAADGQFSEVRKKS